MRCYKHVKDYSSIGLRCAFLAVLVVYGSIESATRVTNSAKQYRQNLILTRPTPHARYRLHTNFSRFVHHGDGTVWKAARESQAQLPRQRAALDRIRSQATDLPNTTKRCRRLSP